MNIPKVKSEESLVSYVYRLMRVSFYETLHVFSSEWKVNIRHVKNNDFPERVVNIIHQLTGENKEQLLQMSNDYFKGQFGDEFSKRQIIRSQFKYCPICIREDHYHKLKWMLEPVSCCLKHKCILLDRCQNCKTIIPIESLMTGTCRKCGFVFSFANIERVDDLFLLKSQKIIQNQLLMKRKIIDGALADMNFEEYLLLVKLSGYLIQGINSFIGDSITMETFHYIKNGYLRTKMSCYKHGNVLWMFENFPVNFNVVRQKFDDLPARNKRSRIAAIKRILSNHPTIKFKGEINRILSITTQSAASQPITKHKSFQRNRKQKVNCAVSKNIIEINKPVSDDCITRLEAGVILGISGKEQINKLIENGFLTLFKYPQNKWFVSKKQVTQLLELYSGEYLPAYNGIDFYEAFVKYSQRGLSLVKLLGYIQEKKLKPHILKENGRFCDLSFCPIELVSCIEDIEEKRRIDKGLTKYEVMKLLKIDYWTIRKLEEQGFLRADSEIFYKSGKRRISFYSIDQIEQFQKRYIDIMQVSQKYQVSPQYIRRLISEGVLKESMPGITKKYMFDINDIAKIVSS